MLAELIPAKYQLLKTSTMKNLRRIPSLLVLITILVVGCKEEDPLVIPYSILPFQDNFESYEAGKYPSGNWITRFDGESGLISAIVAYESDQSFKLESRPSWGRVEAIPLPDLPDYIIYEACILINQADKGYVIGFGFAESSNTYRWRNAFQFANDGSILIGGDNYANWVPFTWYKVKLEVDFNNMLGKAWLDDQLISDTIPISTKNECKDFTLCGNNFNGSGTSEAYFDNIKIYATK